MNQSFETSEEIRPTATNLSEDETVEAAVKLHEESIQVFEQGDPEQAVLLAREALRLMEQAVGPDHPDVANILNHLAGIYLDQGQHDQAEQLCRRAVEILEQIEGIDDDIDRLLVQALGSLGNIMRHQGRYQEAEAPLLRALSLVGSEVPVINLTALEISRDHLFLGTDHKVYLRDEDDHEVHKVGSWKTPRCILLDPDVVLRVNRTTSEIFEGETRDGLRVSLDSGPARVAYPVHATDLEYWLDHLTEIFLPGGMSRSEEADAGLIVSGSYYRVRDSLELIVELTAVADGRLLRAIGPVHGLPTAIDSMIGVVATAVATAVDSLIRSRRPGPGT